MKIVTMEMLIYLSSLGYCKTGNFRATFIFTLFTLNVASANIKTHKYALFMYMPMAENPKSCI